MKRRRAARPPSRSISMRSTDRADMRAASFSRRFLARSPPSMAWASSTSCLSVSNGYWPISRRYIRTRSASPCSKTLSRSRPRGAPRAGVTLGAGPLAFFGSAAGGAAAAPSALRGGAAVLAFARGLATAAGFGAAVFLAGARAGVLRATAALATFRAEVLDARELVVRLDAAAEGRLPPLWARFGFGLAAIRGPVSFQKESLRSILGPSGAGNGRSLYPGTSRLLRSLSTFGCVAPIAQARQFGEALRAILQLDPLDRLGPRPGVGQRPFRCHDPDVGRPFEPAGDGFSLAEPRCGEGQPVVGGRVFDLVGLQAPPIDRHRPFGCVKSDAACLSERGQATGAVDDPDEIAERVAVGGRLLEPALGGQRRELSGKEPAGAVGGFPPRGGAPR